MSNPPQSFTCLRCGKVFERVIYPSRKHHAPRYCSQACLRGTTIGTFTCKACGKPFDKQVFPSRPLPQFCSFKCAHVGTKSTIFICKQCGVQFGVIVYPSLKRVPKFCSRTCWIKHSARKNTICKVCGKVFLNIPRRGKPSEICSIECRALSQYKYPSSLREEMLRLSQTIGIRKTSETLKVSEWYIRTQMARNGLKPNPTFRYQHFRDNPSQLEIDLYNYLDTLGYKYERQKSIGHYVADAFIEPNIVIEADGDYWHGHPRFYPLTNQQKKQRSWDKSKNTYFAKKGYRIIRIWECEMSLDKLKQELGILV